MTRITDCLLWLLAYLHTAVTALMFYPRYMIKNFRYHLLAPSVMVYAVICFVLDRGTKLLAINYQHLLPIPVIRDFFTLTFVKNPGVAFGLFPDWRLPPIIMACVMVVIITYYSFQLPPQERLTRWSLALLVGGAIGNLYDRIAYGYVVDFFLFHFGKFDFPVFNVADVAIDVGVFLLFLDIFFLSEDEALDERRDPSQPEPSTA